MWEFHTAFLFGFEICSFVNEKRHPVGCLFSLAEKEGLEVLRTPLAVPEKIIELSLFLDFFDRCALSCSLFPPLAAVALNAPAGSRRSGSRFALS